MITIKIHEENNKLYLESPFDSIVCGNTNYDVEFVFSKDWEERPTKTALIIAAGRKSSVEFTGNTFHLPPIPNCSTFMILIYANDQYSPGLVTSSIELDAIPTASVGELPEFEDINSYAFEILKRLDNFEDGTTKAKYAEVADVATNIANPNLLINGNFTINQTQKRTNYASKNNTYIIDRWLGTEGMGIYFYDPMFIQKDEEYEIGYLKQIIDYIDILADKDLCLSIKGKLQDGPDYFVSMPVKFSSTTPEEDTIIASKEVFEGFTLEFVHLASGYVCVQLKVETSINIPIDYVKLEYGSTPTALCPTPYAEELLKCQRYCYIIQLAKQDYFFTGVSDGNDYLFFRVTLPCLLRTKPTVTSTATYKTITDPITNNMKEITFLNYSGYYLTCHVKGSNDFAAGRSYMLYIQYAGSFRVDAEIYP